MSRGACIIASNTHTGDKILDYVGLAAKNARLIRKHLKVPVALLTTERDHGAAILREFDEIVCIQDRPAHKRSMLQGNDHITYAWKNDQRIESFNESPWSRTLLLDADYIVQSDQLRLLLDSDQSFQMIDAVYDITGRNSFRNMHFMPDHSIRQCWATVMCFDRSAGPVFEAARMVRDNYDYYAAMFDFSKRPYRNDYAFSIAAHLSGKTKLPWSMAQLPPDCGVEADDRGLKISYANNLLRWQGDLHILNKSIALDPSLLGALDE